WVRIFKISAQPGWVRLAKRHMNKAASNWVRFVKTRGPHSNWLCLANSFRKVHHLFAPAAPQLGSLRKIRPGHFRTPRIEAPGPKLALSRKTHPHKHSTAISPLPQTVCRPTPVHSAARRYGTNSVRLPSHSASPTKPPSG